MLVTDSLLLLTCIADNNVLVANLNSRDPKLYQPMVTLVNLLLKYNADVDSLATEIAFAENENYRTATPLCQAAKVWPIYQPVNYVSLF